VSDAARALTERKWSLLVAAAADVGLADNALRVAIVLLSHLNRKPGPRFGQTWPSAVTIAREAGSSTRTVERSLSGLVKGGYFVRVKGGGGRQPGGNSASTIYRMGNVWDLASRKEPSPTKDQTPPNLTELTPSPVADLDHLTPPLFAANPAKSGVSNPATGDGQTLREKNPKKNPKKEYVIDEDFETWWQQFPPGPRKVDKPGSAKKYAAIIKRNDATTDELLSAVMAYGATRAVADGFSCMPSTWLNQQRWKASLESTSSGNQTLSAMDALRDLARDTE